MLSLRVILGVAFFSGVILYSLWKGGWAERVAAAAMLAAMVLTPIVFRHVSLGDPQWSVAIVDLALLGVLLAIALRARRLWLILASSVHALGTASHVALIFNPEIKALAYLSSIVIWSYLAVGFLMVSTIQHRRRLALYKRTP